MKPVYNPAKHVGNIGQMSYETQKDSYEDHREALVKPQWNSCQSLCLKRLALLGADELITIFIPQSSLLTCEAPQTPAVT